MKIVEIRMNLLTYVMLNITFMTSAIAAYIGITAQVTANGLHTDVAHIETDMRTHHRTVGLRIHALEDRLDHE